MSLTMAEARYRCVHIEVHGAVQGVGFRPYVYRLATALRLHGWVRNSPQGVAIHVEGPAQALKSFLQCLKSEPPPRAVIRQVTSTPLTPQGHSTFTILPSDQIGAKTAAVLPDIATCTSCLQEVFDPLDRRYLYPFINCTNCGPRYSIIEALPYDRVHTTMRHFTLCSPCQREYDDPTSRRFHAQPNACPDCGPSLALWDATGVILATHHEALQRAAGALRQGKIVAVKGLGGFHLMADARNGDAVRCLRQRKQRPEKPLALMYPSLQAVQAHCCVSDLEAGLLLDPAAPIVLVRRNAADPHPAVAPGNPHLGVMLPATPLHHLLMQMLDGPVIATSGNRADEPLCTDETEALQRLAGLADVFLVHDRPIICHVDDSIVRVMLDRVLVLRRARGYAPLPISCQSHPASISVLAAGAQSKNTIAFSVGNDIVVSQHIGDLETVEAFTAWHQTIERLPSLYDAQPSAVICDAHPAYRSTRGAEALPLPHQTVQHHYAHVLACMVDNALDPPVLGVAWDGNGYGLDGTMWGGEFFGVTESGWDRRAYFRPFPLPGGDKAMQEPRRTALGLLYTMCGEDFCRMTALEPVRAFTSQELRIVQTMLERGLQSPLTSSVGRLFDAVASIIGLRHVTSFEGQAAMELEFALDGVVTEDLYPWRFTPQATATVIDWTPMIQAILTDLDHDVSTGQIAATFHNTLAEIIVAIATRHNETRVVLTGGCFQNRYLTERAVTRLRAAGMQPFWHHFVPPNDGGIAVGQVVAALQLSTRE